MAKVAKKVAKKAVKKAKKVAKKVAKKAKKVAKKVAKKTQAKTADDVIDDAVQGGVQAVDVGQHLAMLTDLEMFAMNPEDALLSVEVTIGEKKFKQAMDEVYSLKWDNARRRFSREEISKHMSRCSFYAATFLIASTEAASEHEKLDNFYSLWKGEQLAKAEERIKAIRLEEMEKTDERPKLRTQIGQITQAQIDAEICAEEETKKQMLGWMERIREAKKNKEMMRGLYQITQSAGSLLQTLAKMYMTEDASGR